MRQASRLANTATRPAIQSRIAMGTRAFSIQLPQFKSEVIHENEVPVSIYSPDAKGAQSGSIPVKAHKPAPIPTMEENDSVTPLSDEAYNALTPTMQKMSVKGKVIVITG